ncbi:MAG: hypothetical protein WCS17_08170, partial [Prevotella sp.]
MESAKAISPAASKDDSAIALLIVIAPVSDVAVVPVIPLAAVKSIPFFAFAMTFSISAFALIISAPPESILVPDTMSTLLRTKASVAISEPLTTLPVTPVAFIAPPATTS